MCEPFPQVKNSHPKTLFISICDYIGHSFQLKFQKKCESFWASVCIDCATAKLLILHQKSEYNMFLWLSIVVFEVEMFFKLWCLMSLSILCTKILNKCELIPLKDSWHAKFQLKCFALIKNRPSHSHVSAILQNPSNSVLSYFQFLC